MRKLKFIVLLALISAGCSTDIVEVNEVGQKVNSGTTMFMQLLSTIFLIVILVLLILLIKKAFQKLK